MHSEHFERGRSVGGLQHGKAMLLKHLGDGGPHYLLVFHNENRCTGPSAILASSGEWIQSFGGGFPDLRQQDLQRGALVGLTADDDLTAETSYNTIHHRETQAPTRGFCGEEALRAGLRSPPATPIRPAPIPIRPATVRSCEKITMSRRLGYVFSSAFIGGHLSSLTF